MAISEAMHMRTLAAEFRSRAKHADPIIAGILQEIATDLEADASTLTISSTSHPGLTGTA